ncbi:single-stranded-DNA-specific exonuclease RecJ [Candidatus Berkelbacteria bacterium CG06_land_8_20_14_3_00_43_10]|nr:MAG: single-stranded-DNA-specific exonuclease RecJ [Candidatus Berkelbacteria bacterium CG06_land_8_20_14_3_00_43_10]
MRYMGEKIWEIRPRTHADILDQICADRGIDGIKKDGFLHPHYEKGMHDPFLMKGMKKAVVRIITASQRKEIIGIFADYDADGVTSGAVLSSCLDALRCTYHIYIPSREEGYGINVAGIDYFNKLGVTLLIAVDMGVTGKKEINYAHTCGMDTIVIDHHLVQKDKLPSGIVINPKQKGDPYPFKELSACGIVFKLAQALAHSVPNVLSKTQIKWLLDLTSLSTIADMVPLIDENRIIVHFGLIVCRKTKRIGLKKLYDVASIDPEKISPGVVGFQIAPHINAAGRIDHAQGAYCLLTETNPVKADRLAQEIHALNTKRQEELQVMLDSARLIVFKEKLHFKKIIMIAHKDWKPGLVGLVAGKLTEEFARPALVLHKQKNISRGSARSIEKMHLLKAFDSIKPLLISYGGHARAGGLSFDNTNFSKVYSKLLAYADSHFSYEDCKPTISIDGELRPYEVTETLVAKLKKVEPFGFGNPKPVFVMRSQSIQSLSPVGSQGSHIRAQIANLPIIYFQGMSASYIPKKDDVVDIVFTLEINEYRGRSNVQLVCVDWKQS